MRILITGAQGFVGQHLAHRLTQGGHEVFLVDQENISCSTIDGGVNIGVDIGNYDDLFRAFESARPIVVYHLAAVTGIAASYEQEELCLRTNVLGTYNVMKAAIKNGASKIIFASSREVYGETKGRATREDAETRPNNLYGLTKLMGEEILRWHCKTGVCKYVIFRITNVYGPGGEKYGIHKILGTLANGQAVTIMGGKQLMNFIFIADLIDALAKPLTHSRADDQVFNLAGPDTMTLEDAIAELCVITGMKVVVNKVPMRPTETIRFIPNISKAMRLLGWRPKVGFRDGVQQILASKS